MRCGLGIALGGLEEEPQNLTSQRLRGDQVQEHLLFDLGGLMAYEISGDGYMLSNDNKLAWPLPIVMDAVLPHNTYTECTHAADRYS